MPSPSMDLLPFVSKVRASRALLVDLSASTTSSSLLRDQDRLVENSIVVWHLQGRGRAREAMTAFLEHAPRDRYPRTVTLAQLCCVAHVLEAHEWQTFLETVWPHVDVVAQ